MNEKAKDVPVLNLSANQFLKEIKGYQNPSVIKEGEYEILGLKLRDVFALAKTYINMPIDEIEILLDSPFYEVRVGAVSIMDWKARSKKITEQEKEALFKLYIRRHDRINNWSMVDRAAPYVVGGYLFNKSREVLYELAHSENPMKRRTAIVSTYFFIRQNDLMDTFKIAEILVNDKNDLVQKAVGGWIREAGKKDLHTLLSFLDKYAATMPRTMLRYAMEHLDKEQRDYYMKRKD
jgi:3-methyladenine DNA glycosylase AlkD